MNTLRSRSIMAPPSGGDVKVAPFAGSFSRHDHHWRSVQLSTATSAQFSPATDNWALGTGHWALGTGHWALGTGHFRTLALSHFRTFLTLSGTVIESPPPPMEYAEDQFLFPLVTEA